MKNKLFHLTALVILPLLAACGHKTDGEVLANAYDDYRMLNLRYEELQAAFGDDKTVVERVRLLGADQRLSFGDSVWSSFIGNEHLVYSEGTPLHRAVHVMNKDINRLARHAQELERRALFYKPVYEKINELRRAICAAIRIAQAHKAYIEEGQFIENQRLQKTQLAESRRQTDLLQDIALDRGHGTTHHHHHHHTSPRSHTHHVVHHRPAVVHEEHVLIINA